MSDVVVAPILPCRDLQETTSFYERLGFTTVLSHTTPNVYAIVRRDGVELHFFGFPALDPAASYAGCYVRTSGLDALHASFAAAGLPSAGTPRLSPVEDKQWGMREFHVVDPNGSLLRFGRPL